MPQWVKNGKKLETFPAWNLENVKSKKGYAGSTKREKESPLCRTDGHMSPPKCGVGTQFSEPQRMSRTPRWHCKRCAVFSEQVSSASQMTAAKVMDVIARLPDCAGQAADAVPAYTPENEGRSKIAQNSEVRMSRWMDTSSTTQISEILGKHRRSRGSSWTKCMWSPIGWIVMGETIRRIFI